MKIIRSLLCLLLGNHEWTTKADQGVPPTKEQTEAGMKGFAEYAKMYCKHCGKESELNKRLKS